MSTRKKNKNESLNIIAEKIELYFNEETQHILDGQSNICNWLYNKLLETHNNDYSTNNNSLKLTTGYGFRDYMVHTLKEEYPFIKTVFSSVLKNTALRLKNTFDTFFSQQNAYPKYRSQKEKWFSLEYEESMIGYKFLPDKKMKISLGKGIDNKQICIYGILSRSIRVHDKIYSFRICKEYGKYYGVFVIEVGKKEKKMELKDARKRFVVIDPNHVNVFMCYDYNNESFVLERNNFVKNIDIKIDKITNKLSKERKYVDEIKEQKYLIEKQLDDELDLNYLDGFSSEDELIKLNIRLECIKNKKDLKNIFRKKGEYTYSYNRYLKWLYKLYIKRREQIKTFAYTVAHMLYSKYDYVSYGDYVPSKDTAPYHSMYRKMVQQDIVGYLREIISKSAKKYGKYFNMVSEINTTKDCSYCGDSVKKDPTVRYYTCPNCGKSYVRDLNSCINIALKDKLLSRVDLLTIDISSVDCKMIYTLSRGCVMIN